MALGACKTASNAPPPVVYDNPDNMVQSSQAKPLPSPPPFDTSCTQDSDCAPAPGCCPSPCTSDVINVKDLPRAQALLDDCPKERVCPSAGGCRTFAYLCVESKCALVFEGDKSYRPRQ
jgi:hypothetical protein